MEQYLLVEVPEGMAAVPNLDYFLQKQIDFNSAVMLGLGLVVGILFAYCFFGRWH